MVFTYEEVLYSTDGFSDSNLLEHGTYGSIYYGLLREQVCGCIQKSVIAKHFAGKKYKPSILILIFVLLKSF